MKLLVSTLLLFSSLFFFCCKTNQQKEEQQVTSNTIELSLQGKVKPQRIEAGFNQAYGLVYECYIDKAKNIAIFSFDPNRISQDRLINLMKNEVGISSAKKGLPCSEN